MVHCVLQSACQAVSVRQFIKPRSNRLIESSVSQRHHGDDRCRYRRWRLSWQLREFVL